MKGKFITFEGAEGSGKTTQADIAYKYISKKRSTYKNPLVLLFREPGGVKISESIRKIILDNKNINMTNECETLLYMAARAQLVREKIKPALSKGAIVLCDRFLDSTIAYQGYGNGVDLKIIGELAEFVAQDTMPDLTFLFDIDPARGLARTGRAKDRIENRSIIYHEKVRTGYLKLAKVAPERIIVINAELPKATISEEVQEHINKLLNS